MILGVVGSVVGMFINASSLNIVSSPSITPTNSPSSSPMPTLSSAPTSFVSEGIHLIGSGYSPALFLDGGSTLRQGQNVVISRDGTTVAIAAPDDDASGAVWIFVRTGSSWSQRGSKLTPSDRTHHNTRFGSAIALSAEGDVCAIGGSGDDAGIGATWIFVRNNLGIYNQQGLKIVAADVAEFAAQGSCLALSDNGRTLIIGSSGDNWDGTKFLGATYVFTKNSTDHWTQQAKLVGADTAGTTNIAQGKACALTADGNTAAIGGPGDDDNTGAVWVFTKSPTPTWSPTGPKLVGTEHAGSSNQGYSVALSSDGNTLLVGGPGDNADHGASWVFVRSGGIWSQQGAKLLRDPDVDYRHGTSVSLSSDGNIALTGILGEYVEYEGIFLKGNAVLWNREFQNWSQISYFSGIPPADMIVIGFGESVFLSGDGKYAVIGGPRSSPLSDARFQQGLSWIFQFF